MRPALIAAMRLRRDAEAVYRLGARPLHEMLIEIGTRTGMPEVVETVVSEFAGINPEILVALGGHRFPEGPIRIIGGAR